MREGELHGSNQLLDDIDANNIRNRRVLYAIGCLIVFVVLWVVMTNYDYYLGDSKLI